ncbi:acyltransferase family protein [Pandoraea communis]|uniref:acyltransferase family protein n=1 Tax=Pandoraea communis TaxID=2508297 RepID=UPI0025A66953|nr:acyltransferase family protein [Pandoraea communis]MDM8358734.1 acyltransferase family protein [Pandoraea communis]
MPKTGSHLSHPKYRPDIDGLRAIAVLSVVLFLAFPGSIPGGFIGVDVFFVISGFLISTIIFQSLEKGTFSFAEFYARRVKRIFPALLLMLATCFVFGWFALLVDEYRELGKHIAAGAGFVANIVLWQEAGYFDTSAELKPLLHLWSLGVEEQFYIIWPLLLWWAWKRRMNMLAVIGTVWLLSFLLNLYTVTSDITAAFYSPLTRFWELLFGAFLAHVNVHKNAALSAFRDRLDEVFVTSINPAHSAFVNGFTSNVLSVAGGALLGVGFWNINSELAFPGWWALLPVVGSTLIIAAGPGAFVNRWVLSNRVAVWFGLISFPLYLWHWPLLVFPRIVLGGEVPFEYRVWIVAAAVALSWLTLQLVEKNLRRGGNSRLKVVVLLCLGAVAVAAGLGAYFTNGFPQRQAVKQSSQFGWGHDTRDSLCLKREGRIAEFCRLSKDAKPTVMLLGDSMSWELYFGLAKEAEKSGDTVLSYAQGGCAGFLGFSDRFDYLKCERITRNSIKRAINDESVRAVVFSSYMRYYADTVHAIDFGFGAPEREKFSTEAEFVAYVRESFSKVIRALLAKGKEVVFVKYNPTLRFDPKTCVGRPFNDAERNVCAEPKRAYEGIERSYYDLIDSVLKEYPQVKVIDLADVLCGTDGCSAMRDGKMLYRDTQHLSVDGSEYVGASIFDLIKPKRK